MREMQSLMTRKGQITVPVELRRELGLTEGDRVAFSLDGKEIRLRRSDSVVARTAGALRRYASVPPLTAEELREAAEIAWAEDAGERAR